ncbi:MAG: sulfatase [Planctomycetaceae bacterium]|nr:sulfatase [Planctomycetaceae bacterium]
MKSLSAGIAGILWVGGLVFTMLAGALAAGESGASRARPNVLFIAVDDLNDWVGALRGHPQSRTPNMDRLFAKGVLFSKCYCAAPACNPSRVALMTGLRPSSTGIYHNPDEWRPVLPDAVTIPQHFQQHGYRALGSGKIYHDAFPDPASWHEYAPSLEKQKFVDLYPVPSNVNGLNKAHFDWSAVDAPLEQTGDFQTVAYVVKQLERDWSDQPFFLACGIYRPHLPWYVPREFFEQYPLEGVVLLEVPADDLEDIPEAGIKMAKPGGDHAAVVKSGEWSKAVQGYLASIAYADRLIGLLLDAYERSPQRDNTVIVFWSDHGWHLGEKQHWRKFALWEEATRVPLAIVLPQGKQAGAVCEAPVNLLDIYPTLIELCDLDQRPELEGKSLLPLLENPRAEWNSASVTTHGRNHHAVRSGDWRYIRYADGSEELYDHRVDPREYRNLAAREEYRGVIEQHRRWLPERNVPERKPDQAVRRQDRAKKATD